VLPTPTEPLRDCVPVVHASANVGKEGRNAKLQAGQNRNARCHVLLRISKVPTVRTVDINESVKAFGLPSRGASTEGMGDAILGVFG
jgi:hypothetical protein